MHNARRLVRHYGHVPKGLHSTRVFLLRISRFHWRLFFLNLTLAVINNSYSEAQARIKASKEKLRLEQNEIRQAAHKSEDEV